MKRISKYLIGILLMTMLGCANILTVTAKEKANCFVLQQKAPFHMVCESDGKKIFDWSGPMSLTIKVKEDK